MANALQKFLSATSEATAAELKSPSSEATTEFKSKPVLMRSVFSATPLTLSAAAPTTTEKRPEIITLQPKTCEDGRAMVLRFGKIYKRRKPNVKSNKLKLAPPGQRYCTQCGGYQPLSRFYPNVSRYQCRYHHFEHVKKRRDELQRENPLIRVASIAHWLLKQEWRGLLGRETVGYSEQEVYSVFKNVLNVKDDGSWIPRIVPIDPSQPLHLNNVAAVDKVVGQALTQLWSVSASRALHISLVQANNLIPPNADMCNLDDPFADPSYKRVEYDTAKILAEENAATVRPLPRMDARDEEKPPPPTPTVKVQFSNKEARAEERKRLGPPPKDTRPKLCSWSAALHTVPVCEKY